MDDADPNTGRSRRTRFVLRTMLAIVALAILGFAICRYSTTAWIAERRNFLNEIEFDWNDAPAELRRQGRNSPPDFAASASVADQLALWISNEPTHSQIRIPVVVGDQKVSDNMANPKVQEAARLFPEADIYGISLPWLPVFGPRLSGMRQTAYREPLPYGLPKFRLP